MTHSPEEQAQIDEALELHNRLFKAKTGVAYSANVAITVGQLSVLIHSHGLETVKKALNTVFNHEECKWITSKRLELLTNPNQWAKHVAPFLNTTSRPKGEQAEFGARPEGEGYRRVW